ncbi:MAG TPA: bifunctional 4-hydroxy-2-oxoglutarate aldolase/2-dehydro-3-deoxy-phosphogluconate aldolase [Verrucomicrobiae bacterium]|nr:bifunctional 4-hydroxy-2-oxoglutarate aldolase/2-dehydro-3-deoxy-phosphogluconate aldolase [Verrucomicrobiae bacterium]
MDQIRKKRIVPVAVIENVDDAVPLAEALLAGGLEVIEITFRTTAAEVAMRNITKALPSMLVGAGTVLDADQLERAKDAGARFAVAPGLNEKVVTASFALGLTFIPGVMTPSDVERGFGLGCKLQKFFPAEIAGGVPMLKALAGPYGHTGVKFIPLGGIGPKNAAEYLALPIVAAVGGSWLCDRKLIAEKNWKAITALTAEALKIADSATKRS